MTQTNLVICYFLLNKFAMLMKSRETFIQGCFDENDLNNIKDLMSEVNKNLLGLFLNRRTYKKYLHENLNLIAEKLSLITEKLSSITEKLNSLKKSIQPSFPITIHIVSNDGKYLHKLYRSGKQAKLDKLTPIIIDKNYREPLEFEWVALDSKVSMQGKLKIKGTNYYLCEEQDNLIFKKINHPAVESSTIWHITENSDSNSAENLESRSFLIQVSGKCIAYDEQNQVFSLKPFSHNSTNIIRLAQTAFHDEIDNFGADIDHITAMFDWLILSIYEIRQKEINDRLSELTIKVSNCRDEIISTIESCLKKHSSNTSVRDVVEIGESIEQDHPLRRLSAKLYKINTDIKQRNIESQISKRFSNAFYLTHLVKPFYNWFNFDEQKIATMLDFYIKNYLYTKEELYLAKTKTKVQQLVAQIENLQPLDDSAEESFTCSQKSLTDILNSLQTDKNITSLYVNLREIKPRDLRRLFASLDQRACLQKLNLSYSTLGSKERNKNLLLDLIIDFLKNNAYLSQLNLNGNSLTDAQCQGLANAIKENQGLKTLCLSSATISSKGMDYIINSLKINKTLDTLIIDGNNGILWGNIISLQKAIEHNDNITEIVLPKIDYIHYYQDPRVNDIELGLRQCFSPLKRIKQKLQENKQLKQDLVDFLKAGVIEKLQELLTRHPGLITFKDRNYNNLAHLAVRECNYQLLAFILPKMQNVINPLIANNDGKTPLDLAIDLNLKGHAELLRQYKPTFCVQKFIDRWFLENYKDQSVKYTAKIFPEVTTRETRRELISSHIEEGRHIQAIEIPEWTESHRHEFSSRVDKTSTVRYSINDTIQIAEDKNRSSSRSDSKSSGKAQGSNKESNNSDSTTDTSETSVGGSVTVGGGGLFVQASASASFNQSNSTTQNHTRSETVSTSTSSHDEQAHEESNTISHSEHHSVSLSKDQSDELVKAYSETLTQEVIVQPDMRYEFIVNEEIKKQRVYFNVEVKLKGDVLFTTKKDAVPTHYEHKVSIKEILQHFVTNNPLSNNLLIKDDGVVFKTLGQLELTFNNHITLVRICPYWKLRYLVTELVHEMLKTQDSWRVIPVIVKDVTGTVIEKLRLVCSDSAKDESHLLTRVLQTTLAMILGEGNIKFINPVNSNDELSYIDIQFSDLKSSRELLEGLTFVILQKYFLEQVRAKEKDMVVILGKQVAELMTCSINDLNLDEKLISEGAKLVFSNSGLIAVIRLFCSNYLGQKVNFSNDRELDLTQLGVQNLFVLSKMGIVELSNMLTQCHHNVSATKTLQRHLAKRSFDTTIHDEYLEVGYDEEHAENSVGHNKSYAKDFKRIETVFNSNERPIKSITENHCLIPISNIMPDNTKLYCGGVPYQANNRSGFWNQESIKTAPNDGNKSGKRHNKQPQMH